MRTELLYESSEKIREIQNRNLSRTIRLCLQGHPYYRTLLAQEGLTAEALRTVDDLQKLPVTYKDDYMRAPEAFRLDLPDLPAFERITWDVAYTTGTTTGQPTPFVSTPYDYYATCEVLRRVCEIRGINPDDVIANLFPLTPYPHGAFIRAIQSATVLGAAVVSALTGTPHTEFPIHRSLDFAVRMIENKRATIVWGVSSFLRRVLIRAEEMGANFAAVRMAIVTGEPCPQGLREDLRKRLSRLGVNNPSVNVNLGFTEIQAGLPECCEGSGFHNPAPDLFFFEVLDPKTFERLPDGEKGLLVLTHLNRRGTVLLRYALGDITTLSHERCPHCGRTTERVTAIPYRTGNLVKLKGTLINPDLITSVLAEMTQIEEYQVVFTKSDPTDPYSMDKLQIKVATSIQEPSVVAEEIVQRIGQAVGVRPVVEFVDRSDIYDPSRSMKATRIIDERPRVHEKVQ